MSGRILTRHRSDIQSAILPLIEYLQNDQANLAEWLDSVDDPTRTDSAELFKRWAGVEPDGTQTQTTGPLGEDDLHTIGATAESTLRGILSPENADSNHTVAMLPSSAAEIHADLRESLRQLVAIPVPVSRAWLNKRIGYYNRATKSSDLMSAEEAKEDIEVLIELAKTLNRQNVNSGTLSTEARTAMKTGVDDLLDGLNEFLSVVGGATELNELSIEGKKVYRSLLLLLSTQHLASDCALVCESRD